LTNVSIAYLQNSSAYIADKVFPKVPVKKQSNSYVKYSKTDWRRTEVQKRAPGTETVGVGWKTSHDFYYCHVYGVHKDIDDQVRSNADSIYNLERDSTEFITNQMLLRRDLDWNAQFFQAGVWETEYDGGTDFTQWDDAGSDPVSDLSNWQIEFRKLTGFSPNTMVLGAHTMAALKQHPAIIERIKYTQRGIVSEDLIATLFGVNKLYTSYATVATGPETTDMQTQDAAGTFDFITPSKGALLLYTTSSPSLQTPTAGYTFTWNGYLGGNSQGIRIKRFRMEHIASDRIEAEMTYDQKVVAKDMGVYIGSAVA
jgi:hypothetical protein